MYNADGEEAFGSLSIAVINELVVLGSPSNTGLFEKVCFICNKETRDHCSQHQKLILSTNDLEKQILNSVLTLDDQTLITKLEIDKHRQTICDFVGKEIRYHAMTVFCQCLQGGSTVLCRTKCATTTKSGWHQV